LLITIIGIIPVVGVLVWLLVMLLGLGALWRALQAKPSVIPA
jgi:hypothetical protein